MHGGKRPWPPCAYQPASLTARRQRRQRGFTTQQQSDRDGQRSRATIEVPVRCESLVVAITGSQAASWRMTSGCCAVPWVTTDPWAFTPASRVRHRHANGGSDTVPRGNLATKDVHTSIRAVYYMFVCLNRSEALLIWTADLPNCQDRLSFSKPSQPSATSQLRITPQVLCVFGAVQL